MKTKILSAKSIVSTSAFLCLLVFLWRYENTVFIIMPERNSVGQLERFLTEPNQLKHLDYWTNKTMFSDVICKSDYRITSCTNSKIKLLSVNNAKRIIEIGIYVYDAYKRRKKNGGDVILMWAENELSKGKAAGYVADHSNGSYYGRVQVHWAGRTKIFVKLVSAKENVCLRFRAMEKYGNSVFALKTPYGIHYRFMKHGIIEFTRCAPHSFIYGYEDVCNFTTLNYGYSWFCGRPLKKGLDCHSFNKFAMRSYDIQALVPNQSKDEIINITGHCTFSQNIEVKINDSDAKTLKGMPPLIMCSERPKQDSWTEAWPSGYSQNGNWKFNNCSTNITLMNSDYTSCLRGKEIYFMGDSTLRQYLETLAHTMNLKVKEFDFHKTAVSEEHNIHISWRKHEMPFHNNQFYDQHRVQSLAFQIDRLANDNSTDGASLIVVVHYGSHLQAFPPSVYRSRLRLLVSALRRLLDSKPKATILVKGAAPVIKDTHWFDVRISLIFNDVLFQEFSELQHHIVYLDVFSIYVANDNNYLHPQGPTMQQQVQQLVSYIC